MERDCRNCAHWHKRKMYAHEVEEEPCNSCLKTADSSFSTNWTPKGVLTVTDERKLRDEACAKG